MPAKSKAQRRLFALALKYKRGEIKKDEVSDEVIELAKLPEDTLHDFAATKEDDLPDHVDESLFENEGIVNRYISQVKDKFNDFLEKLKEENAETKDAYRMVVDSFKSKEKLSKEQKEQIGNQLKDVLKLIGFGAASILPGGIIYLLISRISFMKKHMIPSSFLKEGRIEPSSGTGARAGGGFPFGHEYGSVSREAEVELAHIKRDKAEKEVEDEAKARKKKKAKSNRAKNFDDFIDQAGQLTEMDGGGAVAASPTNTTGMGNVTPGEVGSGDKWGDDDEEDEKKKKRAMTQDEWRKWKKKSKKSQKGKRKAKGVQTQMAAWELGGRLPSPVANTIK